MLRNQGDGIIAADSGCATRLGGAEALQNSYCTVDSPSINAFWQVVPPAIDLMGLPWRPSDCLHFSR
jgi:hypothetical protein